MVTVPPGPSTLEQKEKVKINRKRNRNSLILYVIRKSLDNNTTQTTNRRHNCVTNILNLR